MTHHPPDVGLPTKRVLLIAIATVFTSCSSLASIEVKIKPEPRADVAQVQTDISAILDRASLRKSSLALSWESDQDDSTYAQIDNPGMASSIAVINTRSRVARVVLRFGGNSAGCFDPAEYVQARAAADAILIATGPRARIDRESAMCTPALSR
jgi:hypothetical protein